MHVPAPIADQIQGPGAILTIGIGAIAFVLGVMQYGWRGAAGVAAALAVLLIVQLWAESARLTRLVGDLHQSDQAKAARISALEAHEALIVELEAEVETRDQQIRNLQSAMQQPAFGEQRLLETVEGHVKLLDLTQKHRLMSREESAAWPVVRASLSGEEGTVAVTAVVGDEAERLAEEFVTLTDETGFMQAHGQVRTAGNREIRAAFSLADLPYELTEAFEQTASFSPNGYLLQLSGLMLFSGVSDEGLEALRAAALAFSKQLMETLVHQPNAVEQPQLSGGETE